MPPRVFPVAEITVWVLSSASVPIACTPEVLSVLLNSAPTSGSRSETASCGTEFCKKFAIFVFCICNPEK
jgi:hypothetical protein